MGNKTSKAVKPPIKAKPEPTTTAAVVTAPNPAVAKSIADPFASTKARMDMLPGLSEGLTIERVQALFQHLFFMTIAELRNREKSTSISILEQSAIRLLMKTMRELPNTEVDDLDENGKKQFNPDGTAKKKFKSLNSDQLQNEKQSLETLKYLHERAFGKPKVTIEHQGLPGTTHNHLHMDQATVLQAMDNLPKHVVEAMAATLPKKVK